MSYLLNDPDRKTYINNIIEKTKRLMSEEDQILNEQFNGDETAYAKATFCFTDITLAWGFSFDEIRKILLDHLPENSTRRNELLANEQSNDFKTRISYPGGFDAFVKDVQSGWFGNDKQIAEDLI